MKISGMREGRMAGSGWAACTVAALAVAVGCPTVLVGQEPGDADIAGRYEFTAQLGDRPMEGVIELAPGDSAGQLRLGSLPPAEVVGARVSDGLLTLDLRLPEGPAVAVLRLTSGVAFIGEIRVGASTIAITGRKTRAGAPPPVTDFLDHARARIDSVAPHALVRAGEAGLAVAAVEGDARWTAGYGRMEKGKAAPVTTTTLFQVGSISKLVTAWGVMRLVELGRIELDAPVNEYLVRWRVPGSEFDPAEVTVRRLLSHTGGLNVPSIPGVDLDQQVPDLVSELEGRGRGEEWRVRIVRRPGDGFAYSGGGYTVLQLLIEEVTGRPFPLYMRDEVLLPLGMESSFFGWNDTVAGRVATPHSHVPERDRRHRLFAGVAGAGMYTSADDLAKLLAAHFPGPTGEPVGRGVVSPATLAIMMAPDPTAESYGLGYEIYPLTGGLRAVGHGGSNVGWKAHLIVGPDVQLGFAVVSNADEGAARAAVLEIMRDALARVSRTSLERKHP